MKIFTKTLIMDPEKKYDTSDREISHWHNATTLVQRRLPVDNFKPILAATAGPMLRTSACVFWNPILFHCWQIPLYLW